MANQSPTIQIATCAPLATGAGLMYCASRI